MFVSFFKMGILVYNKIIIINSKREVHFSEFLSVFDPKSKF